MPNMGYRGIYAAANSAIGGRILSGDLIPALRSGSYPSYQIGTTPLDEFFKYNVLTLKAVGSNTQQNYAIADTSGSNISVTRNGDVNQGAFSPYGIDDGKWSVYFDGNGDYINTPTGVNFSSTQSQWTVEAWMYCVSSSSNDWLISSKDSTNAEKLYIGFLGTTLYVGDASTNNLVIANAKLTNQWFHLAIVKNGTTYTAYINGTSAGATTTALGTFTVDRWLVGYYGPGAGNMNGYLSNVRIVGGAAVYTSTFTPSITPLTAISGTSLLTCQNNRFKDSSTNNFTITRNGDAKISAFTPFNQTGSYSASAYGGSMYFDGSGDYLTSTYSTTNFDWWTNDYTIEAWVFPTPLTNWSYNDGTSQRVCMVGNMNNNDGVDYWSFGPANDGTVKFYYYNGSAVYVSSSATLTSNQWNHIAMTKSASGITIFVNGVASTTTAVSGTPQSSAATPLTIGRHNNTNINGYISDLRIVKGTAVYSGNFTPPSGPLSAITNTKYLLNGINAGIVDASRKNNTYTVNGAKVATNVVKFDKSIVLNGTNDYISVPNDPLFSLNSDFTVELWFNFSSLGASPYTFISNYVNSGAGWELQFRGDASNVFRWGFGDTAVLNSSTQSLSTGTWYHLAATRNGSTVRLFLNGTQIGSITSSTAYTSTAALWIGGLTGIGQYFPGYIEDVRITNGYARYTANFTPATTSAATR